MLAEIGVICNGITVHGNFHQRQVFSGDTPQQGSQSRLRKIILGTQKQLLKIVILSVLAFPGDERAGLGKKDIISGTGHFQGQFIYSLKF